MKTYFYFLLIIISLGCTEKEISTDAKILKIDWGDVISTIDYSPMVEDSVIIIPLETTDECLIGEVTKIIFQNNLFYIVDNISKSIFVFDMSGKLKAKVHSAGSGPEEYTNISYFTVHGTDMILFDHFMGKFLFYDASGNFIRDKRIGNIWTEELFCLKDKLYLINSSITKEGCYKLFTVDLKNHDNIEKYLPFNQLKDNQGYGEATFAQLGNEALICFFPYDSLYKVKEGEISLSYKIDFGDKYLPQQYIKGDGLTALRTAMRDKYVIGVEQIWQSEKYIFLYFNDHNFSYITIYNKETNEMQTTKQMRNSKLGDLILQASTNGFIIKDELIIQYFNADNWNFPGMAERLGSNDIHFYTEELRQKFLKLANTDGSESNPIILIQKLKK